jgi:hypothetical protein
MNLVTRRARLATLAGALLIGCGSPSGPGTGGPCGALPIATDNRTWTLTQLEYPGNLDDLEFNDIAGPWIVGSREHAGAVLTRNAFRWNRVTSELTEPVPANQYLGSTGLAVNAAGTVLGLSLESVAALPDRATAWFTWLAPVPSGSLQMVGHAIGETNLVAGSTVFSPDTARHATLWQPPNPFRDLGSLAGRHTEATAMSGSGLVTGYGIVGTAEEAFIWSDSGSMRRIGRPAGATTVRPGAILDCGIIGGGGLVSQVNRAWRWTDLGGFTLLPLPAGAVQSHFRGMDSLGVVFGDVEFAAGELRPYAWAGQQHYPLPVNNRRPVLRAVDRCGSLLAVEHNPGQPVAVLLYEAVCD